MQFDKHTLSLYSITQLIKRGDFKLTDEKKNAKNVDWAFVINNNVPVQSIFIVNQEIIVGSELIGELRNFMDRQEGKYLRKVQDFHVSINIVKEYTTEDLEKLILYLKK